MKLGEFGRRCAWMMSLVVASACGIRDRTIVIFPGDVDVAQPVFAVAFARDMTRQENFVLRTDEFAAVLSDPTRGRIYVGTRTATFVALDAESGRIVWERDLPGAVSGVPVLTRDAKHVVLGTDDGVVMAIDLDTLKTRWTYRMDGTIRNPPVFGDGVVYVANSRDQVFALDERDGSWRWQYEREFRKGFTIYGRAGLAYVPSTDPSAPEIGVLYTGFDDGKIVAIGASSSEALWIASVAPLEGGEFIDADGTPLAVPGWDELVVSGQATGVIGLAREDGQEVWRYPVRGAGSVVRGPQEMLLFGSSLEGLHAIDRGGELRWRRDIDPGTLSAPQLVGDAVIVAHADLGLLSFDVLTGQPLARLGTGSGVSGPPTVDLAGRRAYTITNRGKLVALDLLGLDPASEGSSTMSLAHR